VVLDEVVGAVVVALVEVVGCEVTLLMIVVLPPPPHEARTRADETARTNARLLPTRGSLAGRGIRLDPI
jgi:hypothetical protein